MSIVHKFLGNSENDIYSWEGVQAKQFSQKDGEKFIKQIIIGPDDGAPTFVIRFFQLPPGNASPLHKHPHEHGVLIIQGNVRVQIDNDFHDLTAMDSVFIEGETLHQFSNTGSQTLCFVCVVPKSGEY